MAVREDLPIHPALPEQPVFTIDADDSWTWLYVRSLWTYRELLFFLVWRDIKVRYKQTALGAAWAIIQPLFTMLIFTLFFGRLAKMPSDGIPYALFAYVGLLPWTFFSNSVTTAGSSLVESATLITKVYFPRVLIPSAAVVAGLVDFAIAFCILIPLMAFYGVAPSPIGILLLPVVIVFLTLLATAIGLWMAAVNVKYRDIRYALPFVVNVWMFVTPIIYPTSIVPEAWRWLLAFNPLTGVIEAFRSALFGTPPDWSVLGISAILILFLLALCIRTFGKMEDSFADII